MVDSDDYLLPDGLKKISECFESLGVNKWKYAGICSHFETKNGELLGSPFPSGVTAEKIYVLYDRYGMQGDKFMVFRNDLLQRYKYPVYCGERFTGDSLVFNWINDEFPSILLQEKVAHREYFEDGITKNLLKNHLYSPNGMTDHYNEKIRVERYNMKNILKHGVGYVAYGLLAGRKLSRLLNESNRKWLTYLLIVPGILYFIRLRAIKKKLEK